METYMQEAVDRLFLNARSHNAWQDKPVSDELLKELHDITKMGPTSANCCPMRVIFLKTPEAKKRLKEGLMEDNYDKTFAPCVTAVVAYDTKFYERLDYLFPHTNARCWFEGNDQLVEETAFRNSSLQAAYFMLAARALGLDCGPISGFDTDTINKEFFPDGRFKVNLLINIGYGDPEGLFGRLPRFEFNDVCEIFITLQMKNRVSTTDSILLLD